MARRRNELMDLLSGQLSPFGRVVILLALLVGAGGSVRTLVDPPNDEDRYTATQAAADRTALWNAINHIEQQFSTHLQHSARYTEKIERLEADQRATAAAVRNHEREEYKHARQDKD